MRRRWSSRLFGMSLLLALGVVGFSTLSQAEVPQRISYQGVLFDPNGMPMTGSVTIKVALWDDPNAGNLLYDEKQVVMLLRGGVFKLSIGSIDPFNATLFPGPDRYLEVTINGERLTPRQRFDSVPFALHAETVGGVALTGLVQRAELLTLQNQLDALKRRLDSILPCGNGVIDGDPLESCDGSDLGGQTCATFGFSVGTLTCDPITCLPDTSGCSECGNQILEAPEICEGKGDDTACPGRCTELCTCAVCGDGLVEGPEQCDPPAATACLGDCLPSCQCAPFCGNGLREGAEECDGSSGTCRGFTTLCQPDCLCPEPVCGDGIVDEEEDCDGSAGTCQGFTTLCQPDCLCPEPVCGDGIVGPGEQCDGSCLPCGCSFSNPIPCLANCTCGTQTGFCGNGIVEPPEQCDGLSDAACQGGACLSNCFCQGCGQVGAICGGFCPAGSTCSGNPFFGTPCGCVP